MLYTLRQLFLHHVSKTPDHIFVVSGEIHLTYEQVLSIACQRAHILLKKKLVQGNFCVILDTEPLETTLWLLACCLIGVIFVILHPDTARTRLHYILQDIVPSGVIDTRKTFSELYHQTLQLPCVIEEKVRTMASGIQKSLPSCALIETDPAFFVYTSGSTGKPKAVICPHRAVVAATTAINAYLQHTTEDRIGHQLSLSFVYGLYQLFLALQTDASIVFLDKFRSPTVLINQLFEYNITGFPTVRPVLVSLSRLSISDTPLPGLRYITSAGDFLPTSIVSGILDRFSSVAFFYMYGLTECARALYMPPDKLTYKMNSVGRPLIGTRAFLVDDKGCSVARGEIGELVIEGPHVMAGYWNAPDETAAKFKTGLYGQTQLWTGDLFFQDEDADFHFVARKDSLIKCKGFLLSPREIESALLAANPAVRECIVFGKKDLVLGQIIHALVIIEDATVTVQHIYANCRIHMEPHLIPSVIQIVDAFPTTGTGGKYQRNTSTGEK